MPKNMSRLHKSLAMSAVLVTAALVPAQAAELPDPDPNGVYPYPVILPWAASYSASADGRTYIQLEAPERAWGIRKSAKQINETVPGVHIYRYGTCADRPNIGCVKVWKKNLGDAAGTLGYWYGQAAWTWDNGVSYDPDGVPFGLILFNTYWRLSHQRVACHELGHALGMPHHATRNDELRSGCVGPSDDTYAPSELLAFNDWYTH